MSSYTSTMLKLERMTQATNSQQMAWQEKMSGQSHQLEVSDLVKAGLNPVLSAGGNGAQSYTTSLDSGANAIANTYAAKESASATRYAARQSAAATRAAAYANLEAARLGYQAHTYASDKSYEAAKYSSDKSFEATKYSVDNAKTGSWAGLFSNYSKATKVDNEGLLNGLKSSYKDIAKNPEKFVKSSVTDGKVKNMYDLTAAGRNTIQRTLRSLDIKVTQPNQNVVFNAIFRGDPKAMNILKGWIASAQRKQNSAIKRINNRDFMI